MPKRKKEDSAELSVLAVPAIGMAGGAGLYLSGVGLESLPVLAPIGLGAGLTAMALSTYYKYKEREKIHKRLKKLKEVV